MMDRKIQELLDKPLDTFERTNKLWRPEGVRPAKKGARNKTTADVDPNRISMKEVQKRKDDAQMAKMKAVLDFYAAGTVSFEQIAKHTGLTVERVTEAMIYRGRGLE